MSFSIIIAAFNREKFISKCIDSVLSQSFTDFELVIVDDGSTDGTDLIIRSYKDARIKHFFCEHAGCWATKNYGISQASGEYLCFIDSDDFISKDFLAIAHDKIAQNPDYDYYYPTELAIVRENGEQTGSIWRYLAYSLSERANLIALFWEKQIGGVPHAAALIKKSVFQRFGAYNADFFNLSDTAYIVSHALEIKFLLIPELKTYYNRQHSRQTNTNTAERMRTYSEILDEIIIKYPTQHFLGYDIDKNTPQFYEICVKKFMELALMTKYNEFFLKKAEKYIRLMRSVE